MTDLQLADADVPVASVADNGAQVQLGFAVDPSGRTWLSTQRVAYPFHVGRCLSSAGDPEGMATVYVQCCSGGLFERDSVRVSIACARGTNAHVTTSASTIVHGMEIGEATQDVQIETAAQSLMEYLPDPMILFPGARLDNRVRVRLHEDALVLLCDAVLAHDPGGAERASHHLRHDLIVESSSGDLLVRDRWTMPVDIADRARPGIMGAYSCQGSFLVLGRESSTPGFLDALRSVLLAHADVYAGASALPHGCGTIVRALAMEAAALKRALFAVWDAARWRLLGVKGVARRK